MQSVTLPDNRPAVQLTGRSPYTVLAACMNVARAAGWTESQIRAVRELATSGRLEDVVQACREWFEAHNPAL